MLQAIILGEVAGDFLAHGSAMTTFLGKTPFGSRKYREQALEQGFVTYGNGRDVGQVSRDTGSVDDIVEGELVNQRGGLEQERERL